MVFYPPKSVFVASTSLSMIDQIRQKLGIPGLWWANDPDKLSLQIASLHRQCLPVQELRNLIGQHAILSIYFYFYSTS